MEGYLIVNPFYVTDKQNLIYEFLKSSFLSRGVSLTVTNGIQLFNKTNGIIENGKKPDFVVFWDKDVILAKRLESMGIKVFNSSYAVCICDSKILTYLELKKHGVNTPLTLVCPKTYSNVGYTDLSFLAGAESLGYPYVIKEEYGSFGNQVYLVNDREQAENTVKNIKGNFIMQKYDSAYFGVDFRVNVVGGKVICAIKRQNEKDFRSNISNGGTGEKFSVSKEMEEIAVKASACVKADFCGVDVLIDKQGKPSVCEVNSNPHFKSTLDITGVNLADYIADYVLSKV